MNEGALSLPISIDLESDIPRNNSNNTFRSLPILHSTSINVNNGQTCHIFNNQNPTFQAPPVKINNFMSCSDFSTLANEDIVFRGYRQDTSQSPVCKRDGRHGNAEPNRNTIVTDTRDVIGVSSSYLPACEGLIEVTSIAEKLFAIVNAENAYCD